MLASFYKPLAKKFHFTKNYFKRLTSLLVLRLCGSSPGLPGVSQHQSDVAG